MCYSFSAIIIVSFGFCILDMKKESSDLFFSPKPIVPFVYGNFSSLNKAAGKLPFCAD